MSFQKGEHAFMTDYEPDYTEMMLPAVLVQSFTRKHYLVLFAAVATILLRVQIILSSSIFRSIAMQQSRNVEVEVSSSFTSSSNVTDFFHNGSFLLLWSYSTAHEDLDLDVPFGVSNDCAYQTFSTLNTDGTGSRPKPEEPLTMYVNGLFMDAECSLLEDYSYTLSKGPSPDGSDFGTLAFQLQFEDCDDPIVLMAQMLKMETQDKITFRSFKAMIEDSRRLCPSVAHSNRQFMHTVIVFRPPRTHGSLPEVVTCAAAFCSSKAWTSVVEVVDDGISPAVSAARKGPNNTFDFDPWNLLQMPFAQRQTLSPAGGSVSEWYEYDSFWDGNPMPPPSSGQKFNSSDDPKYQSHQLVELIKRATGSFAPIATHYLLRQPAKDRVIGTRQEQANRVKVNIGVCSAMAAGFSLNALLAVLVWKHSHKACRLYYRDPATILGSILQTFGEVPERPHATDAIPREPAPETEAASKKAWSSGSYTSLCLTPWVRVMFILLVLGLISGLLSTLERSRSDRGVATVDNEGRWSFLWQSLPALLMAVVSFYSSSVDSAIRSRALLSDISARASRSSKIDISLLDMLGLRALWSSIQLGVWAVSLSQVLTAACSFLPILGSTLLIAQPVPNISNTTVQQNSWFGSKQMTNENIGTYIRNRDILVDLNLLRDELNFTYARYTYDALLFPSFELQDSEWGPGASARMTTSAAKLLPSCDRLAINSSINSEGISILGSEITPLEEPGNSSLSETLTLGISVAEWVDCPNGTRVNATRTALGSSTQIQDKYIYFGNTALSVVNPASKDQLCHGVKPNNTNPNWLAQTYVWGRFMKSQGKVDRFSAWRCNYSWADISTEVNLLWTNAGMVIDHNNPPVTDMSSIQPWTPPFGVPPIDNEILDLDNYDLALPIISIFKYWEPEEGTDGVQETNPSNHISPEDLGDPGKEGRILESIHSEFAFAAAQLANLEQRLGLDEASDFSPLIVPDQELKRSMSGAITNYESQRVVQSPKVTFIMVAILSLVAMVNVWALICDIWRRFSDNYSKSPWLLDMELRGVAPEGFNSLAMLTALLDGSNITKILPEKAYLMASTELHCYLIGKEFRLGWFFNIETESYVFTVGVLNDDNLVFKGDGGNVNKS